MALLTRLGFRGLARLAFGAAGQCVRNLIRGKPPGKDVRRGTGANDSARDGQASRQRRPTVSRKKEQKLTVIACESLTLNIERRAEMESTLDEAVRALSESAIVRGHGVLVTRVSPTTFVASLSPDVPFGMTQEKTEW
jgi:hypothetical protein